MESQPIHAHKHAQRSRILDQRSEAAFEKSAKLQKASTDTIRTSRKMVQDAKNLISQALRLKKDSQLKTAP